MAYCLEYRKDGIIFARKIQFMNRRAFFKKLGWGAGVAVVAPSVLTQKVLAIQEVKPIVFAQESFGIDGGSRKLTIAAVNTKGEASGYNFILGNLYDYTDRQTTKWWVTGVLELDEGSHRKPWVVLAKLGEGGAKPLSVDAELVVKYVTELVNDARNLTGVKINKLSKL